MMKDGWVLLVIKRNANLIAMIMEYAKMDYAYVRQINGLENFVIKEFALIIVITMVIVQRMENVYVKLVSLEMTAVVLSAQITVIRKDHVLKINAHVLNLLQV